MQHVYRLCLALKPVIVNTYRGPTELFEMGQVILFKRAPLRVISCDGHVCVSCGAFAEINPYGGSLASVVC